MLQQDETEGIDIPGLEAWMTGAGLGRGPITQMHRLAGGTQNLLVRFQRDRHGYVLRRPPLSPRPGADRSIAREAQVLGALAGSAVPHPRLFGACTDSAVIGAPFYLMAPIEGFNPTAGLPALHAGDPELRRAMGFALVDGAVALSRIDPALPALDGFGNSENYLGRQVSRWGSALESYGTVPEWPGLDGIAAIAAWLQAHLPDRFQPGLIHGDYHFSNVMFENAGPRIAAIIDWELATIGDPLIDLAWIVAAWRGAPDDDVDLIRVTPWHGFPHAEELIAHYGAATGRDMAGFDWYVVLACYKLAILIEGTFVRALRGEAAMDTGLWFHRAAQQLLRRALRRIDSQD